MFAYICFKSRSRVVNADVDALLGSGADERWSYVDRELQTKTDMAGRLESALTFLRASMVWLGDKLLGIGATTLISRRLPVPEMAQSVRYERRAKT